jgi:hypothetical protein
MRRRSVHGANRDPAARDFRQNGATQRAAAARDQDHVMLPIQKTVSPRRRLEARLARRIFVETESTVGGKSLEERTNL